MFWRGKRQPVDEAELDGLRSVYAALGMGFPAQASRLFGGEDPAAEGRWCLKHMGRTIRCLRTPDLSDRELFVIPIGWEVIRAVATSLTGRRGKRGDQITVFGEMHCRPRGTWENVAIPFQHVWTLCAGRALRFENIVDATVLRPEEGPAVCAV